MRKAFLILTVLLLAECGLAQEAKFDLSKKPILRPGDAIVTTSTSNDTMEVTVGGKVVQTITTVKQSTTRDEVLAVGASGAPAELRVVVQSAEQEVSAVPPSEKKKIALRDFLFTTKADGNQYVCDCSTITAKEANDLRASQIALLKDITKPNSEWDGYRDRDIALMPASAVPVGHTWEPSADAIKRWTEGRPLPTGASVKVRGAKFRLAAAEGKIAVVEGNVSMTISDKDADMDVEARLTCRIDTQTGVWLENAFQASMTRKQGEVSVKIGGMGKSKLQFTPGPGKPSAAPDWKNKLGWAKPAADTNAFQDKDLGISLDVPKEYKPTESEKQGSVVANFLWQEARSSIGVTLSRAEIPLDLEELVPVAIEAMKKGVPGYKVVQQTPLALADNVPAVLVTATFADGKGNMLTIMALDGTKSVSVTAAAPAQGDVTVEKLTAILKTLRLFDAK